MLTIAVFGSISASMWMRQHPSAPKAVAIISRGRNSATAQRRMSWGEAPARRAFASAMSPAVPFASAIRDMKPFYSDSLLNQATPAAEQDACGHHRWRGKHEPGRLRGNYFSGKFVRRLVPRARAGSRDGCGNQGAEKRKRQ